MYKTEHFEDVETEDGVYSGEMRRHPMKQYYNKWIKHGRGKLKFENGNVYEGQFSFDVLEGNGLLRYASGDIYEGEFLCHQRHGVGVLDCKDGSSYEGHWREDKKHGEGTQQYLSGDRYQGLWEKGKRCGYGMLTFASGDRFEGLLEDDVPHGDGIYSYVAGDRYEGRWSEGKRDGKGIHYTTDGIQMLENHSMGECIQGIRKGMGTVKYPNGDTYCGEWRIKAESQEGGKHQVSRGVKHGKGTMIYPNGDRYEGEFEDDVKQGQGVFYYQERPEDSEPSITENDNFQLEPPRERKSRVELRYEGAFYNDMLNGYGIMYYTNGDQHEGFWQNNKGEGLGFDIKKGDGAKGAWSADVYRDGRMALKGKYNAQPK